MAGLVVDSGGIRQMQQLPDDPALAMSFAKGALGRVFGDKEPGLAGERPALADLLHREIGRLRTSGDPAGIRLAGALSTELERVYTKITDPAVKVGVLERARDGLLEEARAGGPDAAFYKAAAYQNDIIALHLRGLGEPATAQHADTLETLAQRSPALAKAMDELDQIEREYVASKGATRTRCASAGARAASSSRASARRRGASPARLRAASCRRSSPPRCAG